MDSPSPPKFDQYAEAYTDLHAKSVSLSGESPDYFAEYKLACLKQKMGPDFDEPVLDYGCGVGNVMEKLAKRFSHVDGFDPSTKSLEQTKQRIPAANVYDSVSKIPDNSYGLVILSGVLHHVIPAERLALLNGVLRKLRPGGQLIVFEHNPLNPLTRRAVKMCPFDDDAILLWPWEAKRVLAKAGLKNLILDYIVFFPKALSFCRPLEPYMGWLPVGAQFIITGVKS